MSELNEFRLKPKVIYPSILVSLWAENGSPIVALTMPRDLQYLAYSLHHTVMSRNLWSRLERFKLLGSAILDRYQSTLVARESQRNRKDVNTPVLWRLTHARALHRRLDEWTHIHPARTVAAEIVTAVRSRMSHCA